MPATTFKKLYVSGDPFEVVTRVIGNEVETRPVLRNLRQVAAAHVDLRHWPQDLRQALVHVDHAQAEAARLLEHGIGDVLVVEPPGAAARVALERDRTQVAYLVLQAVDRRLLSRRTPGIAHRLRQGALRAGELIHEITRRRHRRDRQGGAVGNAAQNADRRFAVDEHLLHHVRLRQERKVLLRRGAAITETQEVAESGDVETLDVDVMQLHVHHEVVGREQRARRREIVALLGRDRERRGVAGLIETVDLVEDHERRRGGGGRAEELAPGQAESPRPLLGFFLEQPRGGALPCVRRARAPFAVRYVRERER
jgi:hypothetical protein